MDLVSRVPRFPAPGETVVGSDFAIFAGGKGANQACAIAKLGGAVKFVGKVGNDSFGLQLISGLRQAGVDTSNVFAEQSISTGTAAITVASSGENTIVISSGANARVDQSFVADRLARMDVSTVLAQLEIPLEAVLECKKRAARMILNPAPAQELASSVYENLSWITPNETETEGLTGILTNDEESCRKASAFFRDRGVEYVAITLGENGSFLSGPGIECHCPTIQVQSIDSTAAGDAFSGTLAFLLNEGRDPLEAVQISNVAGALSTTKMGAQASLPSLSDVASACPIL
jgi:ribokinase